MILGYQIRAARALLNWTREDLAKKSGVATSQAIFKIENDPKIQPRIKTLEGIKETFEAHGVEFTERGVRLRDETIRILEGKDAYLRLLDDIFYTVKEKNTEVLFLYADESITYSGELEAEERIRNTGCRFRMLIEEGNYSIRYDPREYKMVPKELFHHSPQIIYNNKVAQVLENGEKVIIIEEASLSAAARNTFNLIWRFVKPFPKKREQQ